MTRHGFRYVVVSQRPLGEDRFFPYVLDDVGWARRHGYGSDIQRRITRLRAADPNRRYVDGLPPAGAAAAMEALNGKRAEGLAVTLPDGGPTMTRSDHSCVSDAERTLYGDLRTWFRAVTITQNLQTIWHRRVLVDPAFTAAATRWAICMHTRGYTRASPMQMTDVRGPQATRRFRAAEVRQAVSEARCAVGSGMSAIARRLDHRYAAATQTRYGSTIDTVRRLQHEALPRAGAIMRRPHAVAVSAAAT